MNEQNIQKPDFREAIRELTLMDDVFMRTVMKDYKCAEYVLRIILDNKDLTLDGGNAEIDMKNLWGRSLIMDFAGWEHNNAYNIEVQKVTERESPQFTLYCYSMLSSYTVRQGESFEGVKRKYVIVMIVEGDPLKTGLPISHNSLHNDETGVKIDAGLDIIYVDARKCDENTEVGRLMKDFHQKKAEDMEESVLKEAMQHYKETEEGITDMTETLERYFNKFVAPYENAAMAKGVAEGVVQGQKKEALETVRRMVAGDFDDQQIVKATALDIEEIQEIRKSMNR